MTKNNDKPKGQLGPKNTAFEPPIDAEQYKSSSKLRSTLPKAPSGRFYSKPDEHLVKPELNFRQPDEHSHQPTVQPVMNFRQPEKISLFDKIKKLVLYSVNQVVNFIKDTVKNIINKVIQKPIKPNAPNALSHNKKKIHKFRTASKKIIKTVKMIRSKLLAQSKKKPPNRTSHANRKNKIRNNDIGHGR